MSENRPQTLELTAADELVALEAEIAADAGTDFDEDGQPRPSSDDDLVTDPDREAADLAIIEEVVASLQDNVLDDEEHRTARFAVTKVSRSYQTSMLQL